MMRRCAATLPTNRAALRIGGLLESTVMNPMQTWDGEYLYSSLAEMAAAYLVGLAQNHPFGQGNKRVAFGACSEFLRRNGYQLTLTQDEAIALTLNVINSKIEREAVVTIIENGVAFVT